MTARIEDLQALVSAFVRTYTHPLTAACKAIEAAMDGLATAATERWGVAIPSDETAFPHLCVALLATFEEAGAKSAGYQRGSFVFRRSQANTASGYIPEVGETFRLGPAPDVMLAAIAQRFQQPE